MTWNPADKQGWKRALDGSSSPSAPNISNKKARSGIGNDTEPVQILEGDNSPSTNVKTVQIDPAQGVSKSCEPLATGSTPWRSFLRSKVQRPLPGSDDISTPGRIEPSGSSTPYAPAHAPGNAEVNSVLQSPHSLIDPRLTGPLTSSDASTFASRLDIDQDTDIPRSSPGEVEGAANKLTTSASSLSTQPEVFAPVTAPLLPLLGEGVQSANAYTKQSGALSGLPSTSAPDRGVLSAKEGGPLPRLPSTSSTDRQGFLFGNGGDNLKRSQKSDYFDKIKTNPYTSSLLPRAPSPSIPNAQNATEARGLYKKGLYNQPKPDEVPDPTIEELEKILKELHKKFAKIKAMCDAAGIEAASGVWASMVEIVERNRPNIKAALKDDTGKGLKEYVAGLERWDKAVGHHAILMKLMNYQEQIAVLEKKIKEAKRKAAEVKQYLERVEEGGKVGDENGGEWKGHKTRFGRRFSGLIEKN